MKALVACEESQAVTIELRKLGVEAYSCDIQECSGGHPEWHLCQDVLPLLYEDWDLIIAHPPCTYLTAAANRCYSLRVTPAEKVVARLMHREEALVFFLQCYFAPCKHVAVENPMGRVSTAFRPPDQYINPFQFASGVEDKDNYVLKRTGLWLRGLPCLVPNDLPAPDAGFRGYRVQSTTGKIKANTYTESVTGVCSKLRSKLRSKTFPGIAHAMATQWVSYIRETEGIE